MRWLFVLLIGAFTASDVLGLELSLAPGLSVKNAILYLIGFTLFFRAALYGAPRLRIPSIHIAFFLLVSYAAVSWIVAAKVIDYTGYQTFSSLIALKSRLVDPALMLFAVFYGVSNERDSMFVLKCVLGAIVIANLATIADTAGIAHFAMQIGESGAEAGRVFGAFGHANETGTLIVCTLPALVAMAFAQRGFWRVAWAGGALVSFMVLLMTVSRGAFVGLALGGMLGAYVCRRYVPMQRFVAWGVVALVVGAAAIAVASLVDPQIGSTIAERLMGQSRSLDVGEASSGRTAIWAEAFGTMLQNPTTLLTGFGWDVYSVMPFRYAPHNYYLGMWFDLGIFAVGLFVFILARCVLNAYRAVPAANQEIGVQLLAFVFGMLCLAVAIVFADLFRPWAYIWLYVGSVLRLSVIAHEPAPLKAPAGPATSPLIGAPLPAFHGISTSLRR
jgi:O-antigen ligase